MFIVIVIFIVLALFLFHVRNFRLYYKAAKFPGPITFPVIGCAHHFLGNSEEVLSKLVDIMRTYPSPCRAWLGPLLYFAVYKPDHIKIVCTSPKTLGKADLYKLAKPWLGEGLFIAPVEKWKVHRKLIAPTFNMKILESFVEVFAKQSEAMTREIRKELNGDEFDIFEYVSLCTLDIVCETAMGVEIKAQQKKNSRYIHSAKKIFEIIFMRMIRFWLHNDFIFNLTKLGKEQRECLESMHGLTNEVIMKKSSAINKIDENHNPCTKVGDFNVEYDAKSLSKIKPFLDLLMELSNNGEKFSHEELREEVDTMMIAGNETTASVSSFVMLMLALHPEIQEKAFEELCQIYGDEIYSDRPVRTEDLNHMEYLERVIKETMRIFPVGPLLVRNVAEDIEIDGKIMPKGSSIILGVIVVHRSEEYWPEPMKFDPDRFLPEEVAKRHPYCYLPFSAGPRNCLGMRYAMMAIKVFLATILRRYILKKDQMINLSQIKVKIDVVLKTVDPIKIKIEPRQG